MSNKNQLSGSLGIPQTPNELIKDVEKLVSLPEVCVLINDLINDPLSDIKELAWVISQDLDLTARLLRLVNGAFYHVSAPVDTVSRAIVMVGLRELQNLVIASTAVETFGKLSSEKANMASFWRHSIFCAVVGRTLARECHVLHPERLFVAGLLHDIGRLLILHKLTGPAEKIIQLETELNLDSHEAERRVLGYDHTEVGCALVESWGLPQGLGDAIKWHHSPANATAFELEAAIVHVANIMATALELSEDGALNERCDPVAWRLLNMKVDRLKPIMHNAVMEFLEIVELLLPGVTEQA